MNCQKYYFDLSKCYSVLTWTEALTYCSIKYIDSCLSYMFNSIWHVEQGQWDIPSVPHSCWMLSQIWSDHWPRWQWKEAPSGGKNGVILCFNIKTVLTYLLVVTLLISSSCKCQFRGYNLTFNMWRNHNIAWLSCQIISTKIHLIRQLIIHVVSNPLRSMSSV